MKPYFALPMIVATGVLCACSNNNTPVLNTTDAVFEEFLLDLVSTDAADAQPRSIEDQAFTFVQDDAAFAALFPAN